MKENKPITIAILPFENLSAGNEMDIFCRSFCMDLITELSYFRQFQIVAYSSAQDLIVEPNRLAEKLSLFHIDYVVQGSFRSATGQIWINAQLFEGDLSRLVWGNRLEGKVASLLDIQDHLLKEIVASLQQQLNLDLLTQIKQKKNVPLKAYEYWLHGVDELKKGTVDSDLTARTFFQQALSIEPDYSLAYSGMSLTYFNEWSCQLWDRWEVSQNGAYEWAQKAIAVDEQNYIAAFILGRVFLYEGAYESAEYYLRKSLSLNTNDPESLIQIASCMVYLGFGEEALALYERAQQLNPTSAENYAQIGAFIYFELGAFEKSEALAIKTPIRRWIDTDAFYAAMYFHLGAYEKMESRWADFLEAFNKKIDSGKPGTTADAVVWMRNVNPYKNKTNLLPFWDHITNASPRAATVVDAHEPIENDTSFVFEKQSTLWAYAFDGKRGLLPEVKGFYDIHKLIMNPEQPFHCTELMEAGLVEAGEALLDAAAMRQYKDKLREIQHEISEAEGHSDYVKSAQLQHTYDEIISHLSSSLGLDGISREKGGTVEKARSAITWRIRSAISKIEKANTAMGKHLSNSTKTGTFCVYSPDRKITWND